MTNEIEEGEDLNQVESDPWKSLLEAHRKLLDAQEKLIEGLGGVVGFTEELVAKLADQFPNDLLFKFARRLDNRPVNVQIAFTGGGEKGDYPINGPRVEISASAADQPEPSLDKKLSGVTLGVIGEAIIRSSNIEKLVRDNRSRFDSKIAQRLPNYYDVVQNSDRLVLFYPTESPQFTRLPRKRILPNGFGVVDGKVEFFSHPQPECQSDPIVGTNLLIDLLKQDPKLVPSEVFVHNRDVDEWQKVES